MFDGPIISPETHPSIGHNIQGPSLIRAPSWLSDPLGRYYLYFADHQGAYIRLATADDLGGPWTVHEAGSLQLEDSGFLTSPPEVTGEMEAAARTWIAELGVELSYDPIPEMLTPHVASPDVHVDDATQTIVMYFHGLEKFGHQSTHVATSTDGITFTTVGDTIPSTYVRAFHHDGFTYALAMPGQFYRSVDGRTDFEVGPLLFEQNMRHAALLRHGSTMCVFWTRVEDEPESILLSTIDTSGDWSTWSTVDHGVILRPDMPWEGAGEPIGRSERGRAFGPVHQLRDPCVFEDDGRTFLLYAVAGESGIAVAELDLGGLPS
jgi:hypothetical protein